MSRSCILRYSSGSIEFKAFNLAAFIEEQHHTHDYILPLHII